MCEPGHDFLIFLGYTASCSWQDKFRLNGLDRRFVLSRFNKSFLLLAFLTLLNVSVGFAATLEDGRQAVRLKEFDRAVQILTPLARDDESAALLLAGLYQNGFGVEKDPEKVRELLGRAASQNADARRLQELTVKQEIFVAEQDPLETLLIQAAQSGSAEHVETYLGLGAPANSQGINGRTALMESSEQGHVSVVKLLIKAGAPVNQTDSGGETALFKAVRRGNRDVVVSLIAANASTAIKDQHGANALHLAASMGDQSIVTVLLESGADVNAVDGENHTALDLARLRKHFALARNTLAPVGATGNRKTTVSASGLLAKFEGPSNGRNPLLIAAARGDISSARRLLGKDVNPNVISKHGLTPLMIAASRGHVSMMDLLLGAGAEPLAITKDGRTALHVAAAKDQVQATARLLQVIGNTSQFDASPLVTAVQNNAVGVAELLIQHDKNLVTLKHVNDTTPLMIAVKNGDFSMTELLLSAGSNAREFDHQRRSALWFAAELGRDEMLKPLSSDEVLDKKDAMGNTPLHRASAAGHTETVQELVRLGVQSIDQENESGETPLMLATQQNHFAIVEFLLSAGADIDYKNHRGNTALVMATAKGDADAMRQLIALGANPKTQNKQRQNAFDIAKRSGISGLSAALKD